MWHGFWFLVCSAITITLVIFEIKHFEEWRQSTKESYWTPDIFNPPSVTLCANIGYLIVDSEMKANCTSNSAKIREKCFGKLKSYTVQELLDGHIIESFQHHLGVIAPASWNCRKIA